METVTETESWTNNNDRKPQSDDCENKIVSIEPGAAGDGSSGDGAVGDRADSDGAYGVVANDDGAECNGAKSDSANDSPHEPSSGNTTVQKMTLTISSESTEPELATTAAAAAVEEAVPTTAAEAATVAEATATTAAEATSTSAAEVATTPEEATTAAAAAEGATAVEVVAATAAKAATAAAMATAAEAAPTTNVEATMVEAAATTAAEATTAAVVAPTAAAGAATTTAVTAVSPDSAAPVERRPREVFLAGEEYDEQIVELLNKTFMEDPISTLFWPDPALRERGHRAMFYGHLANLRLPSGVASPASFVNVVVEGKDGDSLGVVRAASLWTTPQGPKATLNYLYYGWRYLGVIETAKWAKQYLVDLNNFLGQVFEEILEKRKKKQGGGGDGGNGGGNASDDGDDWMAFPDFIGADAQVRGQGYGTDVMEDALRRLKEAGKTVFIFSSNSKNLRFYKKHGFQVMAEAKFKGIPMYGLGPVDDTDTSLR